MVGWGILGAAEIARKNWKAIWNSQNGVVVGVASRQRKRARQFIEECQREAPFETTPGPFGSYEELIAAPDVNALYIPLPTGIRKPWVQRAAEAGKHIVCEKPCAASVADLQEMLETCRHYGVQFTDGVMFMHSARLERIRKLLQDDERIGAIKRITAAFAFKAPQEFFHSNIRAQSELEPHGCLGDLGWYCIRFALWLMNWQLPHHVTGRTLLDFKHPKSQSCVPTEFSGELFFEGGISSTFYCSFVTAIEQWVNVAGTGGVLRVPDFVLPFSGSELVFETANPVYQIHGCDFEMQPHTQRFTVPEHSHGHSTAQETNLFRNFAQQVQSGRLNPTWPEMALKTQQAMQACRDSAADGGRLTELIIAA